MKRFLAAMAITSVLSVSAFAGDMPISGAPAPQPGDMPTSGTPAPGDVPSDGKSDLSSEALSALLSALSFLGI
jgi:hypothetical protein